MPKLAVSDYITKLQTQKQEAHDKQWLYIEVNAKDFLTETEPGISNLTAVCKAMLDQMLEGDYFIVEPKIKTKVAGTLSIRYYVDNLSAERKKYSEAV